MNRWFRHYAGMMRDDKLVRVALQSKQTVERVLWVWGAILENAAELNDGGRFDVDHAEIAYFLRADEGDILAVLDGLAAVQRVAGDRVVNWSTRQFESDKSASRQAAYRERRRSQGRVGDVAEEQSDGSVTSLSRHCDAPETETETETEKKEKEPSLRSGALAFEPPVSDDWPKDYREQFWARYPHKVGKPRALKALERARKQARGTWSDIIAGLDRYIREKPPDRAWCNPETWINGDRWGDQPATVEASNGSGRPRAFQDDSRSLTRAADRLIEKAERGEFSFGPRPSLLPAGGSDDVRLLPKG